MLAGCGSEESFWKDYALILRQSWSGALGDKGITRGVAASIPYASLGFRVDGSSETILVLATDNGGDQIWTSSSHVVLQTRDGRIASTVGLPHNVAAMVAENASTIPPLSDALKAPYSSRRVMDLREGGLYGVTLDCRTSNIGSQNISIIGTTISTIRACARPATVRSFTGTSPMITGWIGKAALSGIPSSTCTNFLAQRDPDRDIPSARLTKEKRALQAAPPLDLRMENSGRGGCRRRRGDAAIVVGAAHHHGNTADHDTCAQQNQEQAWAGPKDAYIFSLMPARLAQDGRGDEGSVAAKAPETIKLDAKKPTNADRIAISISP